MSKLSSKISFPIILAGIFAMVIFMALDYDKLDISFYIVLLLLTLFVFFFGLSIGQSLTSPVKTLLDKATALNNGNLSSRVYLETKDELSDLAKAFNQLAERLESSQIKEENTQKSVDIKVRARTQELNDTINALEKKVQNRTIELERLMKESQRLHSDAMSKETEANQFKKELGDLRQKLGKYSGGKQKKPEKTEEENNTENNA
jgi:methyl-accepting chemotaxis protein